ncbi:hypothetical protein BGZ50_007455 [Haplosporangium sp. Z 11]|nr:hypothetical protein BGZ50_007455 [Haplosporangium sp. Z 11]
MSQSTAPVFDLASLHDLDVHTFFKSIDPNLWTPAHYAQDPSAFDISEFSRSLRIIDKAGSALINRHAGTIRTRMKSASGKVELATAQETISTRVQQERTAKNVLRYQKVIEHSMLDSLVKDSLARSHSISRTAASASVSSVTTSSSASAATNHKPTAETPITEDAFLSRSLFDKKDNVDQFFFDNPVSTWIDTRAFCNAVLNRKFNTSCKTAFRRYVASLLAIRRKTTVDAHVREHARAALGIREACFRKEFFDKETEIVQGAITRKRVSDNQASSASKCARINEHAALEEDTQTYLDLLDDERIPHNSLDSDFLLKEASSQGDSEGTQEDLTGEIPEPVEVDRLVGPGTFSSQLSDNREGRLLIDDCDISTTLMKHRRSRVIQQGCTAKDDLLLANFVVTRALLSTLFPAGVVDKVVPPQDPVVLEPAEVSFVARLAAHATTGSFEDLQCWFDKHSGMTASVVRRSVSMFLSEAGLWADTNWYRKGGGDNEDTFIGSLLKPLLVAAFGNFAGCAFRWSRDSLRSGNTEDLDARLVQPDYQVSFGSHAIVLGEFKTATASRKEMEDDYVKLVFMGKRAVDGLYKEGFPSPVVLIHGRGMEVDVYRLSLRAEAIYYLQSLGTFRLVSGPYEFPLLLGLGPLISAQGTARATFELIRSRKKVATNKEWMRGTFDFKGITIAV